MASVPIPLPDPIEMQLLPTKSNGVSLQNLLSFYEAYPTQHVLQLPTIITIENSTLPEFLDISFS